MLTVLVSLTIPYTTEGKSLIRNVVVEPDGNLVVPQDHLEYFDVLSGSADIIEEKPDSDIAGLDQQSKAECTDNVSPWMAQQEMKGRKGYTCPTYVNGWERQDGRDAVQKCGYCANDMLWTTKKYCQASCYAAGCGYLGDSCTGSTNIRYPSQMFQCTKALALKSGVHKWLWRKIVRKVFRLYKQKKTLDEQTNFAACLVRTAGHDLMDFRWSSDGHDVVTATGGSDGCMNFDDGDNMGLTTCLQSSGLVGVYHAVCDKASLGDFLVIAAEAAMARTATSHNFQLPFAAGTLARSFMNKFSFGRPTTAECPDHVGLLPNPEEGCYDLKRVFVDHVYLNADKQLSWKYTAALSGVHTLGGAHLKNSGYNGTWTFDPDVFNNAYFVRMLDQGWGPEWKVGGNESKNQWRVSDKSRHLPKVAKQMMLNSDLCMAFDNSIDSVIVDKLILGAKDFRDLPGGKLTNTVYSFTNNIRGRGHLLNAKERMCCTWTRPDKMFTTDKWHLKTGDMTEPLPALYKVGQQNSHCGENFTEFPTKNFRNECCEGVIRNPAAGSGDFVDCDYRGNIEGPAWKWIMDFAYNETVWLQELVVAWDIATTNVIRYVGSATDVEAAAKDKFDSGNATGNCGCCREKTLVVGDEGFEECEGLKKEDTYSATLWNKSREPTWPLWTKAVDSTRPDVLKKLKDILVAKNLDVAWMKDLR